MATFDFCSVFTETPVSMFELSLTQNGPAVSGRLDAGGLVFPVVGVPQGNRLTLDGWMDLDGGTVRIESWDTSLVGSSLVGSFNWRITPPAAFTGSAFVRLELKGVTRRASATSSLLVSPRGTTTRQILELLAGRMQSLRR